MEGELGVIGVSKLVDGFSTGLLTADTASARWSKHFQTGKGTADGALPPGAVFAQLLQ